MQIIRWSALRRIGSLPLMRAVMFAPLIAYLILFNDYVISFLNEVSKNIGLPPADTLSIANVYYLYYGLILVGIASILYGLVCPASVARFADGMAFAQTVQSIAAKTVIISHFEDVLQKIVHDHDRDENKETATYPDYIHSLTNRMVIEIFHKYTAKDQVEEIEREKIKEDDELDHIREDFYTGSGYLIAENIADAAYHNVRINWYFSVPYRETAAEYFAADIAFIKYEIDDHSWPLLRLSIALLYGLGFGLLLIPSISTFIAISAALLF